MNKDNAEPGKKRCSPQWIKKAQLKLWVKQNNTNTNRVSILEIRHLDIIAALLLKYFKNTIFNLFKSKNNIIVFTILTLYMSEILCDYCRFKLCFCCFTSAAQLSPGISFDKNWPRGVTHVPMVSGHPWARGKCQPNQTIPVFGLFGLQSWLTSRHVCGHVPRATCILRATVDSPWVVDDVRHWNFSICY